MATTNSKYTRSNVVMEKAFNGVFGAISLKGRVISQPEFLFAQSGKAMFKFSLAVNQGKKAEGEKYRPSVIFNVVVFGAAAEWAKNNVVKGHTVIVDMSNLSASTEVGKGDRIFWDITSNNIEHAMPHYDDAQTGGEAEQNALPEGIGDMPF